MPAKSPEPTLWNGTRASSHTPRNSGNNDATGPADRAPTASTSCRDSICSTFSDTQSVPASMRAISTCGTPPSPAPHRPITACERSRATSTINATGPEITVSSRASGAHFDIGITVPPRGSSHQPTRSRANSSGAINARSSSTVATSMRRPRAGFARCHSSWSSSTQPGVPNSCEHDGCAQVKSSSNALRPHHSAYAMRGVPTRPRSRMIRNCSDSIRPALEAYHTCEFGRADRVGSNAPTSAVDNANASSRTITSADSDRPAPFDRARNSIRAPLPNWIASRPDAVVIVAPLPTAGFSSRICCKSRNVSRAAGLNWCAVQISFRAPSTSAAPSTAI